MLTIVMYHYVRDPRSTQFPAMKAVKPEDFAGQLDWIAENHTLVEPLDVVAAFEDARALPDNAALLTFDDGYVDHKNVVVPELVRRGWVGAFFPIGRVLEEKHVPNFNKVHVILGLGVAIEILLERLEAIYNQLCKIYALDSWSMYRKRYAVANHLDSADVIFFKRMLQVGLPEPARGRAIDALLAEFVRLDESELFRELYLDKTGVQDIIDAGMFVGCHSYGHDWLTTLDANALEADSKRALCALSELKGCDPSAMYCYPYGGHNDQVVAAISSAGFRTALTVEARHANLSIEDRFRLPRLDTVHLPTCSTAK